MASKCELVHNRPHFSKMALGLWSRGIHRFNRVSFSFALCQARRSAGFLFRVPGFEVSAD
jgi:hypothetical protein